MGVDYQGSMDDAAIPESLDDFVAMVQAIRWHTAPSMTPAIEAPVFEHIERVKQTVARLERERGMSRADAYEEMTSCGLGAEIDHFDAAVVRAMFALPSLWESLAREPTIWMLTTAFCWRHTAYGAEGWPNPYAPCLDVYRAGAALFMEEDEQLRPTHLVLIFIRGDKYVEESIPVFQYD